MDADTIFPVLSNGEQIMGKYRHMECCGRMEIIAILTNFRLLIRWREMTLSGCCQYSHYSAIFLDSITRIDDTRPARTWHLATLFIAIWLEIIAMIIGIVIKYDWLIAISVIALVGTLTWFILLFFFMKRKFVTLKGDFGSETIIFAKPLARELEGRLSEMVHQRRMQVSIQKTNFNGPPPSSMPPSWPSPSTAPAYYVESEKKKSKRVNNYLPETPSSNF